MPHTKKGDGTNGVNCRNIDRMDEIVVEHQLGIRRGRCGSPNIRSERISSR